MVYYDRGSGIFVRADITYLKQDFSTVEYVANHGPWPEMQRFDYLVRRRELSTDEIALATDAPVGARTSYPQREAVLWALRELTGLNAGGTSDEWSQALIAQQTSPSP